MSFRQRLRRLRAKAEEGGVLVHMQDGKLRRFDVMEVQKEMYLALCDLLMDSARESEVLTAVRSATPESRAAFEERFGPIRIVTRVVASLANGGWVEQKVLTEDGRVERVLYESDSEEAGLVRNGANAGMDGEVPEELPCPPVAGRWLYGVDDEDLSES
jgi:predicted NAD/FAD-binding protein